VCGRDSIYNPTFCTYKAAFLEERREDVDNPACKAGSGTAGVGVISGTIASNSICQDLGIYDLD